MKHIITFIFAAVLIISSAACTAPETDAPATNSAEPSSNETPLIFENVNYIPYIDLSDIQRNVAALNQRYANYFDKYIQYIAPNGKPITILAQNQVSDEQLLKAYNILSFYLTSHKGYNMSKAADYMADNGTQLMMPNGADGDTSLPESIFSGQPLYQMEVPVTGDSWYIDNNYEHRDASYEEILHLVHDNGIGTTTNGGALPSLAQIIYDATIHTLPADKKEWGQSGLWELDANDWLIELEAEGSLEQEYIASVVDSYYGLWEAFDETDGGMWGIYIAKNRAQILEKDAEGYAALSAFLPEYFTYMNRISPDFDGTFYMAYDPSLPYTYKSQYITHARLTGTNNSSLTANERDNILIGNSGNNHIDGQDGTDVFQLSGASSDYTISENTVTDTLGRDGTDTFANIEILRFTDMDISIE